MFRSKLVLNLAIISILILSNCTATQNIKSPDEQSKKKISPDAICVTLKIDTSQYITGKLIDVLVTIKNNSNDTINFPVNEYSDCLTNLNLNKSAGYGPFRIDSVKLIEIAPHGEYLFYKSPVHTIRYGDNKDGEFHFWNIFPEGNYEYSLRWNYKDLKVESNKLSFSILPIPDSLLSEVDDLRHVQEIVANDISEATHKFAKNELLFQKNLGKYFEREYFVYLLDGLYYTDAIFGNENVKTIYPPVYERIQQYITKYSNTFEGFTYLRRLDYYHRNLDNSNCLRQILKKLSAVGIENTHGDKYSELIKVLQSDLGTQKTYQEYMQGVEK